MPAAKSKALRALEDEIAQIRIVNTHSHMETKSHPGGRIPGRAPGTKFDLWDLFRGTYVGRDLFSSGLPREKLHREQYDPDHDPETGWRTMAPFVDRVRGTTYYRSILRACRELYGFDEEEIGEGNWRVLSDEITKRGQEPDWGEHLAKDVCRYAVSVHGTERNRLHPDYFAECLPVTQFLFVCSPTEAEIARQLRESDLRHDERMNVAQACGGFVPAEQMRAQYEERFGKPERLDDVLSAMDQTFAEFRQRGAVAIKIQTAYYRRIRFEAASRAEAEQVFALPEEKRSLLDIARYQDFMIHESVRRAAENNFAVQIHTGLQDGFGNYLDNSNPLHLTNLFLAYPEAKFDIFHGGYPFCGELGVLAKNFANVYLDMCWMTAITLTGCKRWLREWIETVPGNKILWGDDGHHVESCAAYAIAGRKVIAEALAEMVDEDCVGLPVALDLARRILRGNGLELYSFQRQY